MAHLLSILVNDPDHLRCQLHRLGEKAHMGDVGTAALGIGYYGDGDVLFSKRPTGGDLASLSLEVRSQALIAMTQNPGPAFEEDATDPFRFRRWLFAMDGTVERFPELREALVAEMPAFVGRQIRSMTDREHVFGLFLSELKAEGRLDDPEVPAVDVARSLAQAVRTLDRVAREKDHQTRPAPLAAVASNGRTLVAVRRGRPLHYALLEGIGPCVLCGVDERTPESDPRRAEHRRSKAVVLATAPATDGGFIEIPDGSTVAVGRSLEIAVASI